jgi:hypothetical protein
VFFIGSLLNLIFFPIIFFFYAVILIKFSWSRGQQVNLGLGRVDFFKINFFLVLYFNINYLIIELISFLADVHVNPTQISI